MSANIEKFIKNLTDLTLGLDDDVLSKVIEATCEDAFDKNHGIIKDTQGVMEYLEQEMDHALLLSDSHEFNVMYCVCHFLQKKTKK